MTSPQVGVSLELDRMGGQVSPTLFAALLLEPFSALAAAKKKKTPKKKKPASKKKKAPNKKSSKVRPRARPTPDPNTTYRQTTTHSQTQDPDFADDYGE